MRKSRLFLLSGAASATLFFAMNVAAFANKGGIPNYGNSWHVPELDPGIWGSGLMMAAGGILLLLERYRASRSHRK